MLCRASQEQRPAQETLRWIEFAERWNLTDVRLDLESAEVREFVEDAHRVVACFEQAQVRLEDDAPPFQSAAGKVADRDLGGLRGGGGFRRVGFGRRHRPRPPPRG